MQAAHNRTLNIGHKRHFLQYAAFAKEHCCRCFSVVFGICQLIGMLIGPQLHFVLKFYRESHFGQWIIKPFVWLVILKKKENTELESFSIFYLQESDCSFIHYHNIFKPRYSKFIKYMYIMAENMDKVNWSL